MLRIDLFPYSETATSAGAALFSNPTSPEDVHVLWEMCISWAQAMQIVTQQ